MATKPWGLVGLCLLAACAAPPPPKPVEPTAKDSTPEPQSAEWLFATDGVSGGRKAECRAVLSRLDEESECKGALCVHAATLARDWLTLCKNVLPSEAAEVRNKADSLKEKAGKSPSPCEEEASKLLEDGCGKDKACAKSAQSWATRCAEWSTPLTLRMLETRIQRATGERPSLDARGCPLLLADVEKAAACDQQFKCQDAMGVVETHRQRCVSAESPASFTAAALELSVRTGATQKAEAIAIRADSKPEPKTLPLVLEDGSGVVLRTCGKTTKSVADYLAARAACEDGELVVARRFDAAGATLLRVGRFAHTKDAEFWLDHSALRVEGEPKARYSAAAGEFAKQVDRAAKLATEGKQAGEAIALFARTLASNLDAVRNSTAFESALRERDSALVPLFRALGEAKKKALPADLASKKLVPALRRAERLALADVEPSGKIRLGSVGPFASIELAELLPKSHAAYLDVLSGRRKALAKAKPTERELDQLSQAVDGAASRCGQALKAIEALEQKWMDCAFGVTKCSDAELEKARGELPKLRSQADVAYPETAAALASLAPEVRAGAEKSAELAGCREPWW
ncbi:MAG: hypothetical protein U0263_03190 [Polyangiaceae bacterium]